MVDDPELTRSDRLAAESRRLRYLSGVVADILRSVSLFVLPLLALLMAPVQGRAQSNPKPTAGPDWVQPVEVPAKADALLGRLETALPDGEAESALEDIENQLPQLRSELNAAMEQATNVIERSGSPVELEDARRELERVSAPLGEWKTELDSAASRVAHILDDIARSESIWSATRGRPETAAAGDVVVRRVDSTIQALEDTMTKLRAWRARVLTASDSVIDRITATAAMSEKLQATTVWESKGLFVPNSAPLWSRGWATRIPSELPRIPEELLAYAEGTATYVAQDPRPLVLQLLIGAFLMLLLKRFSSRALERLAGEAAAARAARLLERPYSIALLLVLIATPVLHPLAPRRFIQLIAILALFPAARIVTNASEGAGIRALGGLFLLLLLDRVGLALQPLPGLERLVFLTTLALGLGLAFWLSRHSSFDAFGPWMRRAAKLAMLGLVVALLAEVGGWTYLATLLGRGVLASAIAALYVYAAAIALAALSAYALASRTLQRSHLLGRNTAILQWRAERGLRWLGLVLWLYFVALSVGLTGTAGAALQRALSAGVSIGALSLSIGGILAFVLTLVTAALLARFVTMVLEEDVYPRTHLPRGVPYALSTLVRYAFYALGFLFALAAAGVQLGQVAIMVGGLGIGIGLGLQDLVKNFAAGLTLLIERRVQVGDALEMPNQGIVGRVLSIGMRASVIRTWNGAEVVVPNDDLISSAITNWTLSDRLYRIEMPVGVAYGSDLDQVVALLLKAAGADDQLLSEPPPQALFTGFGNSSLDFVVRAWTDQGYDRARSLTSQLGLAIHRTLIEAGIGIPFPQRDLHVVSVTADAGAALSGTTKPD